jgi:hypothetical protein
MQLFGITLQRRDGIAHQRLAERPYRAGHPIRLGGDERAQRLDGVCGWRGHISQQERFTICIESACRP